MDTPPSADMLLVSKENVQPVKGGRRVGETVRVLQCSKSDLEGEIQTTARYVLNGLLFMFVQKV